MLLYVVLAVALPLALACPCPPAPAASRVCGSDLVTYDSLCHLQCAAVTGLSLKHPGPCLATEEWRRWEGCEVKRQCEDAADCGCDGDDSGCDYMCRWNCGCGCGGYPQGGMDHILYWECSKRERCDQMHDECTKGCGGGEECKAWCVLDSYKCGCECVQQAYPAPQRKANWAACLKQHQCHNRTCGECQGDPMCDKRCKKRCRCECAGHLRPRRDLSGEWEECFHDATRSCEQAHSACVKECRDQDCKSKCFMAREDCSCQCRTATEAEWRLWGECKEEKQCEYKACSECLEGDSDCRERCRRKCECGCLGINADSLDDASVQQCKTENGCRTTRTSCLRHCDALSDKAKRQECQHACILASEKCNCECARSRPPERVRIIQHCNYLS